MDEFLPEILTTYLLCFRQAFYQTGWPYFNGFIWALLLIEGRKCVTRISRTCFFIDRSLSGWERFLAEAQWDMTKVTQCLFGLLLKELGDKLLYAKHYLVALDTTYVAKVKGRMLGVQKWKESSQNPDRDLDITGHHWAICGLLCFIGNRWRSFPLLTRLISGQKNPSHMVVSPEGVVKPMSFWEAVLAAVYQIIPLLSGIPLCVVADAYFSKAPFLNPLIQKSIAVITKLRHDAVGWDDPVYKGRGRPPKRGKKWKLIELWKQCPHQKVTAHMYGKTVEVAAVVRDVWLRNVEEKVRVVVVEGTKRPILLISTELTFTAQQIIEIYASRFSLEIAIRDLKQTIGFCDYQSITTLAFLRFTQLCCVAFCPLTFNLVEKRSTKLVRR